ncbi:hypothetical protein [Streptomyces vastus]|uniref:hypothetical protein n=1 Tax=Streptomyces vastus TaxID=285451 RepID=UPI0031CE6ECD
MLGQPLLALGGHRVRDALGEIAVGRLADVPALLDVLDEAVPGQLQHLQDVPLGDSLFDAAGQRRCGAFGAAVGEDRFVRCAQRDAGLLKLVLDLRAEVGAPRDSFDRLADHCCEAPVGALGFFQEISDTAVSRDRNVEAFVSTAVSARVEVLATGLDVIEVGDDHPAGGQGSACVAQLAGQGERRVLGVLGGGAAQPGNRHRGLRCRLPTGLYR